MKATTVGLCEYLSEWGETPGEHAEAELESIGQRLLALMLPRVPEGARQQRGLECAAYAQYRHERGRAGGTVDLMQNRLRSLRLGEFSATLAGGGQSREQALMPAGLCAEARAALADCGLLYRGVSAC